MRKILFWISAFASLLISQIAIAETVKIGFVTTLTGGAGAIGRSGDGCQGSPGAGTGGAVFILELG